MNDKIIVKGARVNNLKDVNLEIPRSQLVVFTGLSGSGKSSLAFDTIYAEGQRRYVESLSAYARQFLGNTDKPDVDSIEGLSPAISIEQKTTHNNPRSTIGTVTEIYDYLRLLYGRIGRVYCPEHGVEIASQTIKQMVNQIMKLPQETEFFIAAPIVKLKKGTHKEVISDLLSKGYVRAFIDDSHRPVMLEDVKELDKNKKHTIEVVVDRMKIRDNIVERLHDSLEMVLKLSDGIAYIDYFENKDDEETKRLTFSENFACDICGFSIPNLEPRLFSFNSPLGACPDCKGLGIKMEVDINLLIPDFELSINEGGIKYYANTIHTENIEAQQFRKLCDYYKIDLDKPLKDFSDDERAIILNGSKEPIKYTIVSSSGNISQKTDYLEGVQSLIERRYDSTTSEWSREWYRSFMSELTCQSCQGSRLSKEALSVKVGGKNIYEFTIMSIDEALEFVENLELNETEQAISNLVIKEIKSRLNFLMNVGLEYLSLARTAGTLSGGEAQRIRLATQIGSALTGVLYVLDEPSIGLHQRDNARLINTLKDMQRLGNTMIVVEHDEDTIRAADHIVDIGPGAGANGGEIVAQGTVEDLCNNKNSISGEYLAGKKYIALPQKRRKGNGKYLEITKASENNLKDIDVQFKLGALNIVTGVSGSGKSTLVNEILYKALANKLYKNKQRAGKYKEIKGLEHIDKVIEISQDPIGRTPRSNPATYTSVFDDIRDLYAMSPEAKARGYQKGRFSFNVKGGRCEACQGDGVIKISMHFLPNVYVVCEECNGKRYNDETLQVTFKGKNIADVLDMRVEEAVEFFKAMPKISRKLKMIESVGLGYIKLGQSATTLSGGEAQRIKLATELQKVPTGKTIYILDEPTTGLHIDDVKKLMKVLNTIVDNGDTVIIIEHNLDVIKLADHIIDLGPEGGKNGGTIVGTGTPEDIIKIKESYTGHYLKQTIERDQKNNNY
ncbi:excinuclease ABC subunit UvrA [Erysipelotrichaceae bacterium OttesenSCG-928-M19]|nr:excinuclease ABC subunit UvrA [Erysipelotrichaceae bacterium OttesenSCG-928-M19]